MKKDYFWSMLAIMMATILNISFNSCSEDEESSLNEIAHNLMRYKWIGQYTDYDVYSYGGSIYTQTWTIYFTSEDKGVMHWRVTERDSSFGNSKDEGNIEFSYSIIGNKVYLSDGSNFVFEYFGDYLIEGDTKFIPKSMDSADYSYLQSYPKGGRIDAEVYVINDNDIFRGSEYRGNSLYTYNFQFGFGANSDDAYKKGMTMMRATIWADNGCFGSFITSDVGKKKTFTLYLSPSTRQLYDTFSMTAKSKSISFNYELEYYNSTDDKWYELVSRSLTIYAN